MQHLIKLPTLFGSAHFIIRTLICGSHRNVSHNNHNKNKKWARMLWPVMLLPTFCQIQKFGRSGKSHKKCLCIWFCTTPTHTLAFQIAKCAARKPKLLRRRVCFWQPLKNDSTVRATHPDITAPVGTECILTKSCKFQVRLKIVSSGFSLKPYRNNQITCDTWRQQIFRCLIFWVVFQFISHILYVVCIVRAARRSLRMTKYYTLKINTNT